jgi:hypothetical protein
MLLNQNQLKKMLVIEAIGEKLYKALASKTKDQNSKSLYLQLAIAESQTAKYIEKEISLTNKNNHIISKGITSNFAGFIFSLLTARQLRWLLRNTLKKRMYKRWFDVYKDDNRELWNLLLKHEEIQHELLKF